MLGLHADSSSCGTGKPQWDYTDGSPADMDFLARHSQDGLTCGVGGSNHLVYTASYTTAGSENPACDPTTGCMLRAARLLHGLHHLRLHLNIVRSQCIEVTVALPACGNGPDHQVAAATGGKKHNNLADYLRRA